MIAKLGLLFPLLSFFLVFVLQKKVSDRVIQFLACWCIGIATSCSLILTIDYLHNLKPIKEVLWNWLGIGRFSVEITIFIDSYSVLLVFIINTISLIIHIYSTAYLPYENKISKFLGYLSFFNFSILFLVVSSTMIQFLMGLELVSLATYLLIRFWDKKTYSTNAALKTFSINRMGDVFFLIGIAGIYTISRSVDFSTSLISLASFTKTHPNFYFFCGHMNAFSFILLFLTIGAMIKSFQFGFHIWVANSLECPIPAAAFIHSIGVIGGIFFFIRFFDFFSLLPKFQLLFMTIGTVTGIFGATTALVQHDIRKIIAYTSCSQLGLIFLSLGAGVPKVAFFHLLTHAFSKALLFLSAGSTMYAVSEEHIIEKMGGLYRYIPFTYAMMWVACFSSIGMPLLSGYYSQKAIFGSLYPKFYLFQIIFWINVIILFLTTISYWRLIIKGFHGKPNMNEEVMAYLQKEPFVIKISLSLLSLFVLFFGYYSSDYFYGFIDIPSWVTQVPILFGFLGIFVSFIVFYLYPFLPFYFCNIFKGIYIFLINRWFIESVYEKVFLKGFILVSHKFCLCFSNRDEKKSLAHFIGLKILKFSEFFIQIQTGYIFYYTFLMLFGIVLMIIFFLTKELFL